MPPTEAATLEPLKLNQLPDWLGPTEEGRPRHFFIFDPKMGLRARNRTTLGDLAHRFRNTPLQGQAHVVEDRFSLQSRKAGDVMIILEEDTDYLARMAILMPGVLNGMHIHVIVGHETQLDPLWVKLASWGCDQDKIYFCACGHGFGLLLPPRDEQTVWQMLESVYCPTDS